MAVLTRSHCITSLEADVAVGGSVAAAAGGPEREEIDCLCCSSPSAKPFLTAQDDLSGHPGSFSYSQCTECGLVYHRPRVPLSQIKPYYDDDYIAYRKRSDWGLLTPLYSAAMSKHDIDKEAIVRRYVSLSSESRIADFGCATGSFLIRLRKRYALTAWGTDFKDFSAACSEAGVHFRPGTIPEIDLPESYFDLVTMWHFLEHDYDPRETLLRTRRCLKPGGVAVIEVPCLNSLSFRLFGSRWPGVQAPQHTALFSRDTLSKMVEGCGLRVVDYLPYGAFPPYFYFYAGLVFLRNKGRGLVFRRHIAPYFVGQVLSFPFFALAARRNLAMQTIICTRAETA